MICPTCASSNHRSTVRIARVTDPKEPRDHFFDESGAEHHHNPSIIVTEYLCSNGHRFAERSSWQCAVTGCDFLPCEAELIEQTATLELPDQPPTRHIQRAPVVPVEIQRQRDERANGRR